jgi:hypothetical protein
VITGEQIVGELRKVVPKDKISCLWDIKQCRQESSYHCFEELQCINIQDRTGKPESEGNTVS